MSNQPTNEAVSVEKLAMTWENAPSIDVVEVRSPGEFNSEHIPGSRNVPLDRLSMETLFADRPDTAADGVYLVCKSGARAENARVKLEAEGYPDARKVLGGLTAWDAAGLPVRRGDGPIALERQVRIAAGSSVLLGLILGLTVTQGFFWLTAFIGAGLVYSGLSNACGMGMLLARMPWNR